VIWLQAGDPRGWGPKQAELHDAQACTGCARCAVVCPFGVIQMEKVRPG